MKKHSEQSAVSNLKRNDIEVKILITEIAEVKEIIIPFEKHIGNKLQGQIDFLNHYCRFTVRTKDATGYTKYLNRSLRKFNYELFKLNQR